MKEIGWELDLDHARQWRFPLLSRGMVEILVILCVTPRFTILDEPTALTFDEVQSLFKVVQGLKRRTSVSKHIC